LVTPGAKLELSIVQVPIPPPNPNEVLIRVEAAPINPSDLGLLLAGVDVSTATVTRSVRRLREGIDRREVPHRPAQVGVTLVASRMAETFGRAIRMLLGGG
jgi:hypothetical protein